MAKHFFVYSIQMTTRNNGKCWFMVFSAVGGDQEQVDPKRGEQAHNFKGRLTTG